MDFDPGQVYQPDADTFLLLKAAYAEARPGDRVLEIGTGSGAIAAELVRQCDVVATDINPHATFCARMKGVNVVRSNLCSGIRGKFDLVIFNPPYLPTLKDERIDDWLEYALDGGETGREVIEQFAAVISDVLERSGRILLLVSSLTGITEVTHLFEQHGYRTEIIQKETVEGEELCVLRIVREDH